MIAIEGKGSQEQSPMTLLTRSWGMPRIVEKVHNATLEVLSTNRGVGGILMILHAVVL